MVLIDAWPAIFCTIASLRDKLRQGDKSLVGNKGYRRFLKIEGEQPEVRQHFEIDQAGILHDARFDGKWVLQTDREFTPAETALKYKELWMVEDLFRSIKSILDTRLIFHKLDATIRGHVFCSFLALVLLKELLGKIENRGLNVEWQRLKRDLDALEEITVRNAAKTFVIRSRKVTRVRRSKLLAYAWAQWYVFAKKRAR